MYIADKKRYDTMVYNRCGKSGLKLPVVSLGLWHNFGDTSIYENMKQIAFSPLAQGLLTKRYLNGIPADSRIATDGRFLNETALTSEKLSQIQALNEIAMERGQTLAEMALSWILKDDKVTSVLIGASKPEQILDNIKIIGHTDFSDEELKKIDDIVNS